MTRRTALILGVIAVILVLASCAAVVWLLLPGPSITVQTGPATHLLVELPTTVSAGVPVQFNVIPGGIFPPANSFIPVNFFAKGLNGVGLIGVAVVPLFVEGI